MSGHWVCRRPCGVQNYTQVADLNGAYCRMFREFASRDWTLESLKVRSSINIQRLRVFFLIATKYWCILHPSVQRLFHLASFL
jgi:hypothetical protein